MSEPPLAPRPIRPFAAGLTDVGRQRKHNEDTVLIRPELGLFAVADGMGGHNAGDVASKLAATSLGNFFEATHTATGVAPVDLPEDYDTLAPAARRLAAGVRKANHDVFTISSTYQQHHGMGSTMVAIHVRETGEIHVGHVGDSRAYRIRDGEIVQLTRDHSLINDALEMKPDLLPEEIARLPKNIITRALGMKDAVKVDIRSERAEPGDVYMLCSDGLTGMVPDQQILEVVGLTDDPQEACELLIAEANDAGGTDNISALIIRIADAAEAAAEAARLAAVDHGEIEAHETSDASLASLGFADTGELDAVERAVDDVDSAHHDAPGRLSDPLVDGSVTPAIAAQLAAGAEVDLDLKGPWKSKPARITGCSSCGHELFVGNTFCVECGTRVESAAS
ncbi:MAG: protein phosphatase 2C domain-containing protein [Byssovorax sp.]